MIGRIKPAIANMEREDQARILIERQPCPDASVIRATFQPLRQTSLFCIVNAKKFVHLDTLHRNVVDKATMEAFARLPCAFDETEHRAFRDANDASGRTYGHPFGEAL